jgi:hypothetical protein
MTAPPQRRNGKDALKIRNVHRNCTGNELLSVSIIAGGMAENSRSRREARVAAMTMIDKQTI